MELEVEATSVGPAGALCRVLAPPALQGEGPALVLGLLPGERARVRLGKTPAQARVLVRRSPPDAATPPRCPRYEDPAPCALARLPLATQRQLKESCIAEALDREGIPTPPSALPMLSGDAWGYRAKAVFAVAPGPAGEPRLGYWAPGTHELRPGAACPLHRGAVDAVARALPEALAAGGLAPFSERDGGGWLRLVTVRVCRSAVAGELAWVLLTVRPGAPVGPLGRTAAAVATIPGVHAVWGSEQGANLNAVVGGAPRRLAGGSGDLWERVGRVPVPLLPGAFYQVNPEGGDLLVGAVLAAAARLCPGDGRRAVDLYCGAGAYALNLACAGWQVTAVEREGVALQAARRASDGAGLHVRFECGDATEWACRELGSGSSPRPSLVILNPPRRGATERLLEAAAGARPVGLVYVSCNPASLARDAAHLQRAGWMLASLQAVDLLPQTAHVETVACFQPHGGAVGSP